MLSKTWRKRKPFPYSYSMSNFSFSIVVYYFFVFSCEPQKPTYICVKWNQSLDMLQFCLNRRWHFISLLNVKFGKCIGDTGLNVSFEGLFRRQSSILKFSFRRKHQCIITHALLLCFYHEELSVLDRNSYSFPRIYAK